MPTLKREIRKPGGRERLMTTARDLFTRRGASNVGINDVTDMAGVARMTLYNNFPSKEALTLAVYGEMVEAALRNLREMDRAGRSEDERILDLFIRFANPTDEADRRGCPFIHASLQDAEPAGSIYTLVQSYKRALREHVLGLLNENRASRAELADQIVILLDGMVTEAYLKGVADPTKAAKRAAVTLLHAPRASGGR